MAHDTQLRAADGSGHFAAHLVMPKRAPAGAVVLIQEIFGVNRNMREIAANVAEMGFVALVPDLFWRQEPGVQLDPDMPSPGGQAQWDKAFALMKGMDQDKAVEDLRVAVQAAKGIAGGNGRAGTMGYCLGGRLAFLAAARIPEADCHVSYYGVGLEGLLGEAAAITKPLLVHIAEKDKFVPPEAQTQIAEGLRGHPTARVHIYPGVDHAFARLGGHSWDARAATIANGRTAEFLVRHLEG
jgi:carboxymethylenebutenolidase